MVSFFAVSSPDNAVDRQNLGQFDLHPAAALLRRNPAPRIPVLPVVDVLQLVQGMHEVAGGRRLGASGGQPHVVLSDVDLQFIDAGLRSVGGVDRKANESRRHGGELLNVALGLDGGAQLSFEGIGCGRMSIPDVLREGLIQLGDLAIQRRQSLGRPLPRRQRATW